MPLDLKALGANRMTMPQQFSFAAPASGDWFTPSAHIGHLILVKQVAEIDPNHWDKLKNNGQGGTVTKVTFDYVDLDSPAQLLVEGAQNSHVGVAGSLKRYLGTEQMVLGRIGQAPASQVGKNPAFVLEDASSDPTATARAGQWLTAYNARQFSPPQQQAPAPGAIHHGSSTPANPAGVPIGQPYPGQQVPLAQQPAYAPPPQQPMHVGYPPPTQMTPQTQLDAYQQAQTVYANTPGPVMPQNTPPAGPPVIPGMDPAKVAELQASGLDIASIQQIAASLMAPQ